MPITLLQKIGTKDMAETFNLNNFLQTYKQATYDPTKQHAVAEERMENRLLEKADTAVNLLTDVVNPLGEYLEKYENVFDQRIYNTEIQSYAKQMFFASQAMRQEAAESTTGQNFVYDM